MWFSKKEPERISLRQAMNRMQKSPDSYGSRSTGAGTTVNKHTLASLKSILTHSPLIFGAINKKSKDLVYAWFEWDEETPDYIVKTTKKWKNLLKPTLQLAIFNAYWSGDGIVEKVYDPDTGDGSTAPPKGSRIVNFKVIDPLTVQDIKDGFLELRGYVKKKLVTMKLHPDRYFRITPHIVSDVQRGISPIDVAYKVAVSMMNADEAYGEYIYRQGNGFMILNIDQANQTEVDEGWESLGKIQKGFVGSERHNFKIESPRTFEAREFDFYFYRALAGVLEMPVSMFIGQNTGDVDIRDDRGEYYSRIAGTQKTLITPVLKKLLTEMLGLKNIEHHIIWNPIYVDPRSQGERARFMASAARMLGAALKDNPDLITVDEAREILGLPPKEKDTPQEPPLPPRATGQTTDYEFSSSTLALDKQDLAAIKHIMDVADKERKLGEKILREQEE